MHERGNEAHYFSLPGISLSHSALVSLLDLDSFFPPPQNLLRSKIYTGYPQPPTPTIGAENLAAVGDVKCLSNYALCAFANCTVSFKSKGVPVAECGCLPVRGGQNVQPDLPNGYAKDVAFSYVDSTVVLDKKVRAESVKLCKSSGKCIDKGAGIVNGEQFNVSPFCQEMQPSPTTRKPTLYGGMFDLISECKIHKGREIQFNTSRALFFDANPRGPSSDWVTCLARKYLNENLFQKK